MAKRRRTSSEHKQQEAQPREHRTRSRTAREQEPQILSILRTIHRPASPEELASRCESADVNAKVVRLLCSNPNSPIRLTENGLVKEVSPPAAAVDSAEPVRNVSPKTNCRKRKRGVSGNTTMPKRRLFDMRLLGEAEGGLLSLPDASSNHVLLEGNSHNERALVPLLHDSNMESSNFQMTQLEHREGASATDVRSSNYVQKESPECVDTPNLRRSLLKTKTGACPVKSCLPDLNLSPTSSNHDPEPCLEALAGNGRLGNETDCLEEEKESNRIDGIHNTPCKASPNELKTDSQILVENAEQEGLDDFGAEGEAENLVLPAKLTAYEEAVAYCLYSKSAVNITLGKDQNTKKVETEPNCLLDEGPSLQRLLAKPAGESKSLNRNLPSQRILVESQKFNESVNPPKQEHLCKSSQFFPSKEDDLKNNKIDSVLAKENMVNVTSLSPKLERIQLPEFDNYIVEEEEGSGGYGTVYRARGKNDGNRFAIKCPHVKAHKHHVDNERKMLERFGGRNFIINYEGSFRSGESECFVLKHVEQDRPEVLKKEIDLSELQWYGHCLFRALACLHKQDVVHRDVKPGNFLFSRKLNKGYLIDFNLAVDLQKKYTAGSKSKSSHPASFGHVPLPQSKSALLNRGKKSVRADLADANVGAKIGSRQRHDLRKDARKLAHAGPLRYRDIIRSQGVKASGITSMKDARITRTLSTERAREPLPCIGRKELISLVQDAVRSPNHDAVKTPVSQRKRVAATPGKIDCKFIYTSPMSQHFTGVAISGARLLKSKGDGRQKREGPCAGTKGFRAPEVLFRSLHQGPKADVWSAGVTLLYLIIGRTPFTGDPERNIKDIAKLKGSEDLWELAKLHDRESSFPEELLDIESLPSIELKSWCKAHTRRAHFFKVIPISLFDLVDKCLTVNPRLRISAEDALEHEFFAFMP